MTNAKYIGDGTTKRMRYIARALALILAGWWTFFGVASGIVEGLIPAGVLLYATMPGLIFLVSARLSPGDGRLLEALC